ncbi:hypothetical protein ElyMa_000462600 [Elysia marginata]|uniref:Kazal-like domain-containing protein n=1 Tax=Elysia marginata TaxID=1093978 RepID=A0AAV4FRS4_9GAST|nr:hypothetical protein ElyMa_000462600 [Elysia marginata]
MSGLIFKALVLLATLVVCVNCRRRCFPGVKLIHSPVCASDGKIYGNRDIMKLAACRQNTNLTVADPATCPGLARSRVRPMLRHENRL